MARSHTEFGDRLRNIEKRHKQIQHGAIYRVGPDGLIVTRPRKRSIRFPVRGLFTLFAVGFAFKTFLLMNLGTSTYNQRVSELQDGNVIEKAGAWVMQIDPVTLWMTEYFSTLIN